MKSHLNVKYPSYFLSTRMESTVILSLLAILSSVTLASCAGESNITPMAEQQKMNVTGNISTAPTAVARAPIPEMPPSEEAAGESVQVLPQLIKRAELNLLVKSIDQTMKEVSAIARKHQGDIMGFQDNKPQDPSIRHTASIQLRVPQQRLQTALEDLAKLGTVQYRSLTAEDVSTQLVDLDARLRNLRKGEETVLKIMERSGSVGDVLKAAKELNTIRESIERIDAQLKSLRNQVAFSTINLNLEAVVSASPVSQPPLGVRIQETWGQATHSVSEFTLGLLSLTIWLFAFSPYLVLVALAVYGFKRFRKQKIEAVSSLKSGNSIVNNS
ncbi:MAG: DUF4349 domain-containing protein [Oscillatoriaceae bacterium SKW80]|nr:DUF4349 domain-containing protein [Oscillatoriaceae bacterium SKYG93]MCX8121906.1 DUF4349 domain-containing protein [Oscillatoriaceae bacterium SKW80]MDW8454667.1 DUF4349 domain-containing protein [Oscillatoriaceae cyanobacterium SKYGB_i_bin93]HIK28628.1 DUF4349 domain-containing protein [Oscillatoriaceae cyanobacterium M7585_C2015_266]